MLDLTGIEPPRSVSKKSVEASVAISEKIIEQVFPNITVEVVNALYKTTVAPLSFQLTIKGPYHLVKELTENAIIASIDLKEVKPGRYSKKAAITLPEAITVVEA
ncbi:MAG: hypothetical protein JRF49_04510, partial [Deltaproteobacteria bacterium]|nr:hypothetical protein [Deltaproteobacteria bacterium]